MFEFHKQMTEHEQSLDRLEPAVAGGGERLAGPNRQAGRIRAAAETMAAYFPRGSNLKNETPEPERRSLFRWIADTFAGIWKFVSGGEWAEAADVHDCRVPNRPVLLPQCEPHRSLWKQRWDEVEGTDGEVSTLSAAALQTNEDVKEVRHESEQNQERLVEAKTVRVTVVVPVTPRRRRMSWGDRILRILRIGRGRRSEYPPPPVSVPEVRYVTADDVLNESVFDLHPTRELLGETGRLLQRGWKQLLDQLNAMT